MASSLRNLKNMKVLMPLKWGVNQVLKFKYKVKVRAQFRLFLRGLNHNLDVDIHYILSSLKIAQKNPVSFWKYTPDFLQAMQGVSRIARQSTEALFNLYNSAMNVRNYPGQMAVVGAYKGGDALLVARIKNPDCELYLFDTYDDGMPESQNKLDAIFTAGSHKVRVEDVKALFKEFHNVYVCPGLFPASAEIVKQKQFKWVHLDVNLYQSTIDALNFLAPRMTPGGIILCDDYWNYLPVRQACNEFLQQVKNNFILLPLCGSHTCLVRIH